LLAPLGNGRRDDEAGSGSECSIGRVKRLYAWVAGAAGGLAAYRAVKGRRLRPRPEPGACADARAEALKARLRQARKAADDRDSESGVPDAEAGPLDPRPLDPEPLDPGARRAQVHEQGRAALDEMRGEQRS
ncbi:MAG: hypothetical protein ACXWJ1_17085, partial [Caldimonas sp.]